MLNSNNVGAFHETSTKVKLDTFKVEDEKNYEDEIGLKVIFAYFRKKDTFYFFTRKANTVIFIERGKALSRSQKEKILYI